MLAGFVAGEGSFVVTTKQPPFRDGAPRLRFLFQVAVAARDRELLEQIRALLGFGSIHERDGSKPHHLRIAVLSVASITAHRTATIPWLDAHLLLSAKREQYTLWRDALYSYEIEHPSQYGKGRSTCSEADCDLPVRGRGLCRRHYYRATGY